MEDEAFDEFEEATYSQAHAHPTQPSPFLSQLATALPPFESQGQTHAGDLLKGDFGLQLAQNPQTSAQKEQASGGESIWQSMGKSSSSHVISDPPIKLGFTKNYSLNEQISTPITQDFYALDILESPAVQNNLLLPTYPTNISQNQPSPVTPIVNDHFLMEFSQTETPLSLFGPSSIQVEEQASEKKVELTDLVTNVGEVGGSKNLYAHLDFASGTGFDLLAPITENKPILEVQKIADSGNPVTAVEDLANNDHLMQFDVFEQPAQPAVNVGDLVEVVASPATQSSLFDFGFTSQPKQSVGERVEVEDNARKESDEFQFHQAKPAQVEVRKQSQEFVFQTHQEEPPTQQLSSQPEITEDVQETYVAQQSPQDILSPQIVQNTESYSAPQQQEGDHPNSVEQHEAPAAEDDDEFGDFEETTGVQDSQQETEPQSVPVASQQDNTVTINEEYINSQESEFYRNRQKELQQFVDALPDYSFLFAKAFVS